MLENTHVVRKMDDLGRVVIPREMRDVLELKEGSEVTFELRGNLILLTKTNAVNDVSMAIKMLKNALVQNEHAFELSEFNCVLDKLDEIKESLDRL